MKHRHHSALNAIAGRALPIAAAMLALVVAACGNTTPTTPNGSGTAFPSAIPSATPTESPTPVPTPQPSIYPVPTSRLGLPATLGAQLDDTSAAALQSAVNAVKKKYAIPGLSVAIVFPDGSMWTGQAGSGVVSPATKVDADTLFAIGSISKTYTSAMALRLVEQGVLGLDDPVSRYLPDYPNGAKITLRQLLNHTSGIRDIFEAKIFAHFDANHSTRWTPDKVLALVGSPYFAPGTNYHYSTTNYIVLGQVIEKATGKSLASLVHSEFLVPLGLTHTYLQWEETPKGTFAHGYVKPSSKPGDISKGQSLIPFVSEATAAGAGGGMVSSAGDVAIWATALYDGAFFDEATMASLLDVTATAPYKPTLLYGLGFEELPVNGQVAIGHRGHVDGFWSGVAYYPNSKVTIAVLSNADWINPLTCIGTIYSAIPK